MKSKVIVFYATAFFLMFCLRLVYGYVHKPDFNVNDVFSSDDAVAVRNYASSKIKVEKQNSIQNPQTSIDQKYEKIAEVKADSSAFDEDEKKIRNLIESSNAVIQLEQKTGNPGKRKMSLVIGVQPEKFDLFYDNLLKSGRILLRRIIKTDKTNDFLKLNASRASLEKTRSSLLELKNKSGNIDEFIKLQNRILEVEKELQTLGVQLGSYDDLNEFCTVRYFLEENSSVSISIAHRLIVSLGWTIKYYFVFCISTFFVLFSAGTIVYLNGKINFKRFFRK